MSDRSRVLGPTAEVFVLPAAAILVSLLLFGGFVAAAGANALEVYRAMFRGAFGTWFSFQNTLQRAAPLMLTALCTALPARLGLIVIGGEGALVLGGLAAAGAAHTLTGNTPWVVLTGMLIAAFFAGGAWIALAGGLRSFRGVNETISSLLLNYIAIAVFNHLVEGAMRDPESLNKPSTWPIGDDNALGSVPGMDVHYGLVYGVIACLIAWVLMQKTTFGFAARMAGGNVRAALLAGLPVRRLVLGACFLAGGAAGIAGLGGGGGVAGSAHAAVIPGDRLPGDPGAV